MGLLWDSRAFVPHGIFWVCSHQEIPCQTASCQLVYPRNNILNRSFFPSVSPDGKLIFPEITKPLGSHDLFIQGSGRSGHSQRHGLEVVAAEFSAGGGQLLRRPRGVDQLHPVHQVGALGPWGLGKAGTILMVNIWEAPMFCCLGNLG